MGVSERFPAGQHSLPSTSQHHLHKISKMFKTALFLTLVAVCLGDQPAPSGGYGAPSEGGDDIGAKLGELIPLFLVVFAAIILAQLLAPLLLGLLGAVVGILPMALAIKAPIVNLILAPFNLQLCTPGVGGAAPTAFPRSFSSRSLKDAVTAFGYDVSEDKIEILSDFFNNAMESFLPSSSTYESA